MIYTYLHDVQAKSMSCWMSWALTHSPAGCAMLGMAPSASRAKEAIWHLEAAFAGKILPHRRTSED